MKKLLSTLLALVMLFSFVPAVIAAENHENDDFVEYDMFLYDNDYDHEDYIHECDEECEHQAFEPYITCGVLGHRMMRNQTTTRTITSAPSASFCYTRRTEVRWDCNRGAGCTYTEWRTESTTNKSHPSWRNVTVGGVLHRECTGCGFRVRTPVTTIIELDLE